MIRDEWSRHHPLWWIARGVGFVVVLWALLVGTVLVFAAIAPVAP